MKEQFVPHNLAVRLKKLGFDEPCFTYWTEGLFENRGKYSLQSIMKTMHLNTPYKEEIYGYDPRDYSRENKELIYFVGYKSSLKDMFGDDVLAAPLWQQAFDWMLKNHNLHYHISYNSGRNVYSYSIYQENDGSITGNDLYDFFNYGEARLETLMKMIQLIEDYQNKLQIEQQNIENDASKNFGGL